MFRRYSSPIIALDLVKQHEKRARESMVGREFRQAIEVVNESIPLEHKVRYIALDYSRITSIAKGKNKGGKAIGWEFFFMFYDSVICCAFMFIYFLLYF